MISADPEILIGDNKIKRVSNRKFLSVVLDEQLNWHNHIDDQCAKKTCTFEKSETFSDRKCPYYNV